MQIHPFKKKKTENSKEIPVSGNNKKKPPVIHNVSKPLVNHSMADLNVTTPKKENDIEINPHTPRQTFEPTKKTYVSGTKSELDYTYHHMPQLNHNREHFSKLEDNSKTMLKAYHQEKNEKKKKSKDITSETSKRKSSKNTFDFLMTKDSIEDTQNLKQTENKTSSFSLASVIQRCFNNIKTKLKNLFSKIYYILSQKHIAKEFFWTGSIIVVCIIIGYFLSTSQKHNMIFFSLEDNTIRLANAESIASQFDNTSSEPATDYPFPYDEYEEESDDWEDEEYSDEEYWEDEEYLDEEYWEDEEYLDEEEDLENEEVWEEEKTTDSFLEESQSEEDTDKDFYIDDTEEEYISPIDFDYLQNNDPDIYSWIYVPGTGIDDPILQNGIDDYYSLDYNSDYYEDEYYDDEDSDDYFDGFIYTESLTSTDFTDNHTIIYGHNMENGTIFSDLDEFLDSSFFNEFDTIYIYTPEEELTYTIFAAYLFEDIDLLNTFDFSEKEIYSTYLSKVLNMSSASANIRKNVTVTDTDKIITLMTCYDEDPEQRVYVQAVLNKTGNSQN